MQCFSLLPQGYVFDSQSGYYYGASSGLYYDLATGGFLNTTDKCWCASQLQRATTVVGLLADAKASLTHVRCHPLQVPVGRREERVRQVGASLSNGLHDLLRAAAQQQQLPGAAASSCRSSSSVDGGGSCTQAAAAAALQRRGIDREFSSLLRRVR